MSADGPPKSAPKRFQTGYLKAVWRDCVGCCNMASELVCGADLPWSSMCGAGPRDLGGSRGSVSAENAMKNEPKIQGKPGRWAP